MQGGMELSAWAAWNPYATYQLSVHGTLRIIAWPRLVEVELQPLGIQEPA